MADSIKLPESDPQKLLQYISDAFPSLSWKSFKVIRHGWDHEVIILDDKLVFRFPNDDEYLELLESEIKVLKQLEPLVDIDVPRYQYVAPDSSFAGYPMIHGNELTRNYFDGLDKRSRSSIARQLAKFLSTMHTIDATNDMYLSVPPSDTAEAQVWIKSEAEHNLHRVLTADDFKITQSIINEVDELMAQKLSKVLIHGDVYESHLFWNESTGRLGLIDFSDMNQGDPAFDFAEIHFYGKDFVDEVYENYNGPKDSTFLDRAWAYQRWVGILLMADHFINHKLSFDESREIFDRFKNKPKRS